MECRSALRLCHGEKCSTRECDGRAVSVTVGEIVPNKGGRCMFSPVHGGRGRSGSMGKRYELRSRYGCTAGALLTNG